MAVTVTTGAGSDSSVYIEAGRQRTVEVLSVTLTSDNAGDAVLTHPINGEILNVVFNPGDGLTSPTAAYDVTVTDPDGVDILVGGGANLSASASTRVAPAISTYHRVWTAGTHTFTGDNMGTTRTTVLKFYIGQP